jgi:predicted MPP superfamily phosphohydrolase
MIVSRGVGCSNVPLRINADPEVVICELRGAD